MPYEAISEEQYKEMVASLDRLDFSRRRKIFTETSGEQGGIRVEEVPDKFCETDTCTPRDTFGPA